MNSGSCCQISSSCNCPTTVANREGRERRARNETLRYVMGHRSRNNIRTQRSPEHLVNKRNIQMNKILEKKGLHMVTYGTHTAVQTGLVEAAILRRAVC